MTELSAPKKATLVIMVVVLAVSLEAISLSAYTRSQIPLLLALCVALAGLIAACVLAVIDLTQL